MCQDIVQSPANAPADVEAFAERMMGILNSGALSLMISIGHRTGLFDALSKLPPSSPADIAKSANLQERYVREWLGAVTTGNIVTYDPETELYSLPSAHAALLTREAVPNNIAATAQWIAVLGSVEDKVVDCFTNGGGVPYSAFDRFHQVMAEESHQSTVVALRQNILPLAPGLTERLSAGIQVLDVGCGSGWAMIELADAFPNSTFLGYDISEEGIAAARQRAKERGLANVTFEVHDVKNLGAPDSFDLITAFDAIHDQADPAGVLKAIEQALRPDGTFLMQDIKASSHVHQNADHPIASFIYTISCMHCMTVSLAQGGAGLGAAWGRELALKMLEEAGFGTVDVQELEHDAMNYYYVVQKN